MSSFCFVNYMFTFLFSFHVLFFSQLTHFSVKRFKARKNLFSLLARFVVSAKLYIWFYCLRTFRKAVLFECFFARVTKRVETRRTSRSSSNSYTRRMIIKYIQLSKSENQMRKSQILWFLFFAMSLSHLRISNINRETMAETLIKVLSVC